MKWQARKRYTIFFSINAIPFVQLCAKLCSARSVRLEYSRARLPSKPGKHRISHGQEFVIGGYFPGPHGFGSIIVGYYRGSW